MERIAGTGGGVVTRLGEAPNGVSVGRGERTVNGVVRILQISDTHIATADNGRYISAPLAAAVYKLSGRTTSEALERVLAEVASSGFAPDLVLHTGDVVDTPDPRSYEVAAELLAKLAAPALVVPGNHDDPAMLAEVFGSISTMKIGGWLVIGLDSRIVGAGHGAIDEESLVWLEQCLSSTEAHVVIGLHHPPLSVCGDPYCRLENSYDLLSVLDRHAHVRGVLSGHLHLCDEVVRRQVRYLLAPSTCIQLTHHHPLPDNNRAATAVGARLLELHPDGRIESEIVWASLHDG